jgi:uncharacterized Zn-binding protein involved in type VI secretion
VNVAADDALGAPMSGSIPMGVGSASLIRIPGCIAGSIAGYKGGELLGGEVYDWAEDALFTPLPEVAETEAMALAAAPGSGGMPVAREGDLHSCPMKMPTPHRGGPIVTASAVVVGGMPAACIGDKANCSGSTDTIVEGSATVLFEGRPVARVGSLTDHSGRITTGDATVLIGGPSTIMRSPAPYAHYDNDALACFNPPPEPLMCVETMESSEEPGMKPCPPTLPDADEMEGWQPYHGNSAVFHCGYDGILEDRSPTPGNPMNECFYDEQGVLVDENHEYSGCRGTPDQYDSKANPWKHTFEDEGGIRKAGAPALAESIRHEVNETADELNEAFKRMSDWFGGDD